MARTTETLSVLVNTLHSNCGDLYGACRAAMVSVGFVTAWCKDDKEVAAQIEEAERVGAYALESEAIRRAVYGDEKGVYFKGEKVGHEYVRSDGLLTKLLEGRLPERYRKGYDGAPGGITINGGQAQINIMPRAGDYAEWLRMKDETINHKALPAPDMIDVTPTPSFEGLGL